MEQIKLKTMNKPTELSQAQKDLAQMEELINTAIKSGLFANIQSAVIVNEAWERIKKIVTESK